MINSHSSLGVEGRKFSRIFYGGSIINNCERSSRGLRPLSYEVTTLKIIKARILQSLTPPIYNRSRKS